MTITADDLAPLKQALADLLVTLRKAARLSQQHVADQVGYARVTITCAEKGHRVPAEAFWSKCDDLLDARGALRRAYAQLTVARRDHARRRAHDDQAEREARTLRDTLAGLPSSPVPGRFGSGAAGEAHWELSLAEEGEAEPVRRDEFLRLGAAAVLGSVLTPPLIHGWAPDSDGDGELDEAVISQMRAQTAGYRWLDRQEGAWTHLPDAARHARQVVERWRAADARHPLRSALAELAADACHLVAYQVFDQGRRGLAADWYRCSADLAARAGNRDLYVFAICGVAYMQAMQGQATQALDLLRQTERLPRSAAASSYVHAYQGHALLAARDTDGMFRSLDTAAVFADQTTHEAPSPWLGITGPAWVQRQRGTLLARLGSPDAVTALTALQQQTPPLFARFHVTVATDLARTHATAGDHATAAACLTAAAALNRRIRSVERAHRIRAIRDRLGPAAPAPALEETDYALRSTGLASTPTLPRADPEPGRQLRR